MLAGYEKHCTDRRNVLEHGSLDSLLLWSDLAIIKVNLMKQTHTIAQENGELIICLIIYIVNMITWNGKEEINSIEEISFKEYEMKNLKRF